MAGAETLVLVEPSCHYRRPALRRWRCLQTNPTPATVTANTPPQSMTWITTSCPSQEVWDQGCSLCVCFPISNVKETRVISSLRWKCLHYIISYFQYRGRWDGWNLFLAGDGVTWNSQPTWQGPTEGLAEPGSTWAFGSMQLSWWCSGSSRGCGQ